MIEEVKENKSITYNPESCCNSDCWMMGINDNPGQPCWGKVFAVDEVEAFDGLMWIHSCEGHQEMWDMSGLYCEEQ